MGSADEYALRYAAQYAPGTLEERLVELRNREVWRWIERFGALRILEVGSGPLPAFTAGDRFDSWHVVEAAHLFAESARELSREDPRVSVVEGRLEAVVSKLQGEDFELVALSSVLHELEDPARALEAVRRLCRPRTVIYVVVPNGRSFHRLLAAEMGLVADPLEPSKRDLVFRRTLFVRESLEELLVQTGFELFESGTFFVKPFSHDQMDALLGSGAFPLSLAEGLERMARHLPELGAELYAVARPA